MEIDNKPSFKQNDILVNGVFQIIDNRHFAPDTTDENADVQQNFIKSLFFNYIVENLNSGTGNNMNADINCLLAMK